MIKEDFDLCIVGAGTLGVLTALHALENNSEIRIALLDARMAGQGTTFVSSAMLLGFAFDDFTRKLTSESAHFYEKMKTELPHIFNSFPFYWVESKKNTSLKKLNIYSLVEINKDEVYGLPLGFTKDNYNKYYQMTGYRIDLKAFHDVLLKKFLTYKNSYLLEGAPVNSASYECERIALSTPIGIIKTKKCVVSLGPWILNSPFKTKEISEKIRIKKIVSFHLSPHLNEQIEAGIGFIDNQVFLAPNPSKKQWIMSLTSEDWDVSPEHGSFVLSNNDIQIYNSVIKDVGLKDVKPIGASVFADAYSDDFLPMYDLPETYEGNLIICTGTSGYGIKIGPALAKIALEEIGVLS